MKVEVIVKYKLGHFSGSDWEWSKLFCPNCGAQSVWIDQDEGDYYQGSSHVCINCDNIFTMPSGPSEFSDDDDRKVIPDQIRKGVRRG